MHQAAFFNFNINWKKTIYSGMIFFLTTFFSTFLQLYSYYLYNFYNFFFYLDKFLLKCTGCFFFSPTAYEMSKNFYILDKLINIWLLYVLKRLQISNFHEAVIPFCFQKNLKFRINNNSFQIDPINVNFRLRLFSPNKVLSLFR